MLLRNEIKEILNKNISDEEKKEMIAKLNNTTTDLARIIKTSELLDLEEDQIVDNLGLSWTDQNDRNNTQGFEVETNNNITYLFTVENASGYKVEYLEDEEDEVYQDLCFLLGTDVDCFRECEVLVNKETKFEIKNIYDERDEVGIITVELKVVK